MSKKVKNEVFYREATDYLVNELTRHKLTVIDLCYRDTHFIRYHGTDSIVTFKIDEIPDFLFGIWWNTNFSQELNEELYGYLFARYNVSLDELSPLHASLKDDLIFTFDADHKVKSVIWDLSFIDEMRNNHALAWYCDSHHRDIRDDTIKISSVEKKYQEFLESEKQSIELRNKYDQQYLKTYYATLKKRFKEFWIIQHEEDVYPRYEAVTLSEYVTEDVLEAISDDDLGKLTRVRTKLEADAQKRGIFWSCPISIYIFPIKNKSWLKKKTLWSPQ